MAKSYKPFKMAGHTLPGINQKAETENMEDGRSPSSALQQKGFGKGLLDKAITHFTSKKGSQFYKPEKTDKSAGGVASGAAGSFADKKGMRTLEGKMHEKTHKAIKKNPDRDLSKMPFGSQERIDEYKKRDWAMDKTTHPEKKRTMESKMMMTKTKGTLKKI